MLIEAAIRAEALRAAEKAHEMAVRFEVDANSLSGGLALYGEVSGAIQLIPLWFSIQAGSLIPTAIR